MHRADSVALGANEVFVHRDKSVKVREIGADCINERNAFCRLLLVKDRMDQIYRQGMKLRVWFGKREAALAARQTTATSQGHSDYMQSC